MSYAEAVLFVDYHQAEISKLDVVLDQRMRAYGEYGGAVRKRLQRRFAFRCLQLACQHLHAQAERLNQLTQLAYMLLRE